MVLDLFDAAVFCVHGLLVVALLLNLQSLELLVLFPHLLLETLHLHLQPLHLLLADLQCVLNLLVVTLRPFQDLTHTGFLFE